MPKFSFTSTAEQVAKGHDLTGKVALVTGGNSGIGVETARVLALHGCRVIVTSRKADAAEAAIQQMKEENAKVGKEGLPSEGDISYVVMDLTDLDSVKAGVDSVLQQTTVVDYVVLNAGVMMPPYTLTKHNMELQMGTNHFGHFVLTERLLSGVSNPPKRVIVLSSRGHMFAKLNLEDLHWQTRKYEEYASYGNSKLANVLYAKELNERANGKFLAVSVHPGAIFTGLGRHLPKIQQFLFPIIMRIPGLLYAALGERGVKSVPQGAATTIWAVVTDDVKGGEYCADCSVARTLIKDAENADVQKKLWQITEEQLKIVEAEGALPKSQS